MNCAVCGKSVPWQDRGDGMLIPASRYWDQPLVPYAPEKVTAVFCGVEHSIQHKEDRKHAIG